jgi:hypothetical protein
MIKLQGYTFNKDDEDLLINLAGFEMHYKNHAGIDKEIVHNLLKLNSVFFPHDISITIECIEREIIYYEKEVSSRRSYKKFDYEFDRLLNLYQINQCIKLMLEFMELKKELKQLLDIMKTL